jgi:hypothetical protein
VILSAPWGQKPGEFGIYDPYTRNPKAVDQGPIQGPSAFTIAPTGDIYICDIFNERIQRFSPEGTLISVIPVKGWRGYGEDLCADQNENIYILYPSYIPARVCKFDQTGNLLREYVSFEDQDAKGMNYGGGSTRLYCDNSGRLFLSYYKANERTQAIFQFGTTITEFTPEQQKATLRRGSGGMTGIILNKDRIFQFIDGKMLSVDNSGKPVVEFKSLSTYSFLDVDSLGNAYLTSYNIEKNTYSVRKQTPDGKIISSFDWEYQKYQLPAPRTPTSVDTNKELTIDAQGNIYVLSLTNSGVTITKWSPAGGK